MCQDFAMERLSNYLRKVLPLSRFLIPRQKYLAISRKRLGTDGSLNDVGTAGRRRVIMSFVCGFVFASAIAFVLVSAKACLWTEGQICIPRGIYSGRFTFTPNWAGVVLSQAPRNQRFAAVKATLTVPSVAPSPSTATEQSVLVWVGIDLSNENFAGLRTGISVTAHPSDGITVEGFYQWGPDGPHRYTKLGPVSFGHTLDLEVVMFNETFAKAEIHNTVAGKKATKYWRQPPTSHTILSGQNVGWMLEDASGSSTEISKSSSLLDFERLALEHCIVWTDKDELMTADQGDAFRIRQAGVSRTGVHVEEEGVYFTFIE